MDKRVFVCYRRQDEAFAAGRLADWLTRSLGHDTVFRYVDDTGAEFGQIAERLLNSDVALVIIGNRWLLQDSHGQRRLDDPNDFLRVEIEYAFARHVPVIPVLIEDASLPFADQLPDSLRPLSRINPLRLSDRRFEIDAAEVLEKLRAATPRPPAPPDATEKLTAEDLVLIWTSWRSRYDDWKCPGGDAVYRFDVVIGAEPPVLDRIEKVIYFLPPSWGERSPAAVVDRPSAFRLKEIAWWDLVIRARVYIRGQAEVISLSTHIWLLEHGHRIG